MNRRKNKLTLVLFLELISFVSISVLPLCESIEEAILLDVSPAEMKYFKSPYKSEYDVGYFNKNYRIKIKDRGFLRRPSIPVEKYFQIEPSDAIVGTKYSQPALDYHQLNSYQKEKVPLNPALEDYSDLTDILPDKKISASHSIGDPNQSSKLMSDSKIYESIPGKHKSSSRTENVTAENVLNLFQADSAASELDSYQNEKVPLTPTLEDHFAIIQVPINNTFSTKENIPLLSNPNSSSNPMKDLRFLKAMLGKNHLATESFSGTENMTTENGLNILLADISANENSSSEYFDKNNFTDTSSDLLSVSSEKVLSYENPSSNFDKDISRFVVPVKKNSKHATEEVMSSRTENPKPISIGTNHSTLFPVLPKMATESSVVLNTHPYIELINQTYSTESSVTTTVLSSIDYDLENISSSSPSFNNQSIKLSPGIIAGVVIGVLVCVTLLSSAVIYLLYRRYNGKCAMVVEGKFNSDNCGYLDDSLRSSIYLNNHIELPKESSEEMSSLDNDSFLNSLETMTIQNYWADNSKNTKV